MPLQPTLQTKNYHLRPSRPADHPALAAFAHGPRVWDQHNRHHRGTPEGFRAFFDEGLALGTALTFVRKTDDRIIGSCRYAALTDRGWEIGWTYLDPAVWGTGANNEIKQALLRHAFDHVPNVVLHVWQDNHRSQAAVRKLGAQAISHLHLLAPQYPDTIGFLLTRDEWKRQNGLRELRLYLTGRSAATLVFVCTHNSRRSHLAAVVMQALGRHWSGEPDVHSAGTEATACHPNTVAALRRAGHYLRYVSVENATNPRYQLFLDGPRTGAPDQILWSKTIDDPSLPKADFAAIMVCSDADANCPAVRGAEVRITPPFDDPKRSDGTGLETVVYDAAYQEIYTALLGLHNPNTAIL